MRMALILPRVEPAEIKPPTICPNEGCGGKFFRHLQEVDKTLRDTVYPQVKAHRYACLRCKRSFRVYPQGGAGRRHRIGCMDWG